jgi:hypothetical protein
MRGDPYHAILALREVRDGREKGGVFVTFDGSPVADVRPRRLLANEKPRLRVLGVNNYRDINDVTGRASSSEARGGS